MLCRNTHVAPNEGVIVKYVPMVTRCCTTLGVWTVPWFPPPQPPTSTSLFADSTSARVTLLAPASSPVMNVSFSTPGAYRFSLTVSSSTVSSIANVTVWVPQITSVPTSTNPVSACFVGRPCAVMYAWQWLPLYVSPSTVRQGGQGDSAVVAPPADLTMLPGVQLLALQSNGAAVLNWYSAAGLSVRIGTCRKVRCACVCGVSPSGWEVGFVDNGLPLLANYQQHTLHGGGDAM